MVAIIVVGPKDLPKMLRAFGKTVGTLKRMAREFQGQFTEALEESELNDLKKDISNASKIDPLEDARRSMQEFQKSVADSIDEKAKAVEVNAAVEDVATKPTTKKTAAKKATKKASTTKTDASKTKAVRKPATTTKARTTTTAGKTKTPTKTSRAKT